jgi:hypothetical protein
MESFRILKICFNNYHVSFCVSLLNHSHITCYYVIKALPKQILYLCGISVTVIGAGVAQSV